MQNNNQRITPNSVQFKGVEPVSQPVELMITQIGQRPDFQSESNLLAFAESLNKFSNGTLQADRALRLHAQKVSKEIYLKQEDNKREWKKLGEQIPLAARLNPYTKEYYNDLRAEKVALDNIAQMQSEYTKSQLAIKSPQEVEGFFNTYKFRMLDELKENGLNPSNSLKAIESFETAKTAVSRQYIPEHAEYNYKSGLGILREKLTNRLKDLDLHNLAPADKITAITSAVGEIVEPAVNNGVVPEDIANQSAASFFNYVSFILDDEAGVLDEAELLQAVKQIKIGGRTMNELVPNFDAQLKEYISNAYEKQIQRASRHTRLEEIKIKNALVAGAGELSVFTAGMNNPNSSENSRLILKKIDEICSRDDYFKRNKSEFLKMAFEQNQLTEEYNDRFSNKTLVADYLVKAALNPSAISMNEVADIYRSGNIGIGSFKTIVGAMEQAKNKELSSELQLLTSTYSVQTRNISTMELDEEFKRDMLNKLSNNFINAYRGLSNPFQQNPEAFKAYQTNFNNLTTNIEKQNRDFITMKSEQNMLDTLNKSLKTNQKAYAQGLFKNIFTEKQYGKSSNIYKNPDSIAMRYNFYHANQDISGLLSQNVTQTSGYNDRNGTHKAYDYAASTDALSRNTLVANIFGQGRVLLGNDPASGKFVKVTMIANPKCSYYVMHLGAYVRGLSNNMLINANTPLGFMGNTGRVRGVNSDGTHTHVKFEYNGKAVTEQEWRKRLGV